MLEDLINELQQKIEVIDKLITTSDYHIEILADDFLFRMIALNYPEYYDVDTVDDNIVEYLFNYKVNIIKSKFKILTITIEED